MRIRIIGKRTGPTPPDDDRVVAVLDPDAKPGDVLGPLARLLIDMEHRRRGDPTTTTQEGRLDGNAN